MYIKKIIPQILLSFLVCVFLSTTNFAVQKYVEITTPIAKIKADASVESQTIFTTNQRILFATDEEKNGFYKIKTLYGDFGWVEKKDAIYYYEPPEAYRIGLVNNIPKPLAITSTNNIAIKSTENIKEKLATTPITISAPSSNATTTENTLPIVIPSNNINTHLSTKNILELISTLSLSTENKTVSGNISSKNPTVAPSSSFVLMPATNVQIIPTQNRTKLNPNKSVADKKVAPSFFSTSLIDRDDYRYPKIPSNLNLDINGFFESKFSVRDYNPKDVNDSRFETIRNDPYYNKLPRDVLVGDPKFEMRYRFNIDGQLNDKLSVHYDVEKEPDLDGDFDIRINYDRSELAFRKFDAVFTSGEFVNVKKSLDGVRAYSKGDNWETQIVTGRQRSEPQIMELFGNGQTNIKFRNRNILENSVSVYLNNSKQKENFHYKVNYFDGSLDFTVAPQKDDFIKIIYEFTNPIEDFIPVLSRKNFLGFQYEWQEKPQTQLLKTFQKTIETLLPSKPPSSNQTPIGPIEFFLKNGLIVPGTETVKLNGTTLIRNEDYYLRNHLGKLILLDQETKFDDSLSIEYEYYIQDIYSEDIIAEDSKGPYKLKNENLIEGSVSINIGDQILQENLDYYLDYELGKLYFNYKISYPKIISITYRAIKTKTYTPDIQHSPFNVGVTYLTESVQSQEEELEKVQTETITITANTLTTLFNPILDSKEIKIFVIDPSNGAKVSANYSSLNPYTGKFTLTAGYPVGATKAEVTYTYKKSFSSTFTFQGQNIGGAEYKAVDIELTDTPVKYKSIKEIRLFEDPTAPNDFITLREGSDYIVDYKENDIGNQGIQIGISFLLQSSLNPGGNLLEYPDANSRIRLLYDYTPGVAPDEGQLTQTMLGFNIKRKFDENWSGSAEIVGTQHNFSRARVPEEKSFKGNAQNNFNYTIGRTNIVEDSEAVFLTDATGKNTFLTNGTDYSINYTSGTIRFINLNPSIQDTITISYQYFDTSQTTTAGDASPLKFSSKFSGGYNSEDFKANADIKIIDKDFLPLGPINESKGSISFGGDFNWILNSNTDVKFDYRNRSRIVKKDVDNNNINLTNEQLNLSSTFKAFNYFNNTLSTRFTKDIQDKENGSHVIDKQTSDINLSSIFGPTAFRQYIRTGFSIAENDYLDRVNLSQTDTMYFNYSTNYTFQKLLLLGRTSVSPYLNRASNTTRIKNGDDTFSNRTKFGVATNFKPSNIFYGDFNYNLEKTENTIKANNTQTLDNELRLNYIPFTWLSTDYSHRRDETESAVSNQSGSVSLRNSYRVNRFSPFGLLKDIGLGYNSFLTNPIKRTLVTYAHNDSSSNENNNLKKTTGDSDGVNISNIEPITGIKLTNFSYNIHNSENENNISSSTVSKSISSYTSTTQKVEVTSKLNLPILDLFSYKFNQEESNRESSSLQQATNATNNENIDALPRTLRTQYLEFNPMPIIQALNKFTHIKWGSLNGNLEELLDINKNRKTTILTSTNNTKTNTIRQDRSEIHTIKANAAFSPFHLFNGTASYLNSDQIFDRNVNISNQGTTFKFIDNYNVGISMQPFKLITITGGLSNNEGAQYRSPSIDAKLDSIKNVIGTNGATTGFDFLFTKFNKYNANVAFRPFQFLSVNVGYQVQLVSETFTTANSQFKDIRQDVGSAGLNLYLIKGLNIGYNAAFKQTDNKIDNLAAVSGYTGTTTIKYTPFSDRNFNLNIEYVRSDTTGNDLNDLDRITTLQGTNNDARIEIKQRDDSVETGSINANIIIPLPDSPYVENIVITAEGYLKKVSDRFDSNKGPNDRKNSYDISGLILKGTVNF